MKKKKIEELKGFKNKFIKEALESGFTKEQSEFLGNFFGLYMSTSVLGVESINTLNEKIEEIEEELFYTCGDND